MKVLNVGGGTHRDIPAIYGGWGQDVLDIDPNVKPDVLCDAKEMRKLKAEQYDSIYCSHNLEHFYKHEVPSVLAGFQHVLKKNGFAYVVVPDLNQLFESITKSGKDVSETWYQSPGGPISFHDVLYGWGKQVSAGNLYYVHKTGFTEKSLGKALRESGFNFVYVAADENANLHGLAFKKKPTADRLRELGCR